MKRVERLYPLSYQTEKMDCGGVNRELVGTAPHRRATPERDVVSTAPPLHLKPFAPVFNDDAPPQSPYR